MVQKIICNLIHHYRVTVHSVWQLKLLIKLLQLFKIIACDTFTRSTSIFYTTHQHINIIHLQQYIFVKQRLKAHIIFVHPIKHIKQLRLQKLLKVFAKYIKIFVYTSFNNVAVVWYHTFINFNTTTHNYTLKLYNYFLLILCKIFHICWWQNFVILSKQRNSRWWHNTPLLTSKLLYILIGQIPLINFLNNWYTIFPTINISRFTCTNITMHTDDIRLTAV